MSHRLARITLSAALLTIIYGGAWVACGCSSVTYQRLMPQPVPPNTNAVLSLVGRFGLCHACPIAPDLALTAAHCVDMRPFDASVPAFPARYSNADGTITGSAYPLAIANREDLAVVELEPKVGGFYPLALEEPQVGQPVWWLGYNYKSRGNALRPRTSTGDLVYVVAGNVVVGAKAEEGASGGCILTGSGEVVGIVTWGMDFGLGQTVAMGPGVWGTWPDELLKEARERQLKLDVEEILRELEGE